MGQWVNFYSEYKFEKNVYVVKANLIKKKCIVIRIRPETKWSNHEQVDIKLEDRTRICCKRLGWLVVWSEKLSELGDSWFSTKSM